MNRTRCFFLALGLLCSLVVPPAVIAQSPILSASEINYPPFCFVDDDSRAGGFSVELMRAALASMGRDVTFRTGPWAEVRGWLERGEVQALPLVGRTPEREFLFDFTFPYMSLHGAIVVRQDTNNIQSLNDLRGGAVAVMKGDNAEEFLRREERGIHIHTLPTFEEALQALSAGRYDAVVIQRLVALRLIQETGLANLKVINRPIEGFRQDFCFAVKEGDRETLALLNECLALVMADGTYRHLHSKWFAALELPTHRRIVIGGDHEYPPFEYLDENDRPAGYNVDLTWAIAREMGLDIEIRLGPWAEIVQDMEEGRIDLVQGMFYLPGRDLKFDFTQPHTVHHYVSVMRRGEGDPPATLADLADKRIVVQRRDAAHDFLVEKGLVDQISLVETQADALRELSEGKHDCALAVRISSLYLIKEEGWKNLVLGRQAFLPLDYCYAAPNGHRAILAQFSEGLKVLENNGERHRIYEKWLGVYQEKPLSLLRALRYSAMVLIPLFLILLGFFLWSWSLRRQVSRRTAELAAVSERHQAILASVPDIIMEVDVDKIYTWANRTGLEFFGEDVIGKEAADYFICEQDTYEVVQPLFNGNENVIYVESWQRRKDGEKRLLAWWCRVLKDNNGNAIGALSTARDITEKKYTEEALRESEANYRLMVENQTDLVVKVDPENRFLFVSPSYCRMFGKKEEELLGKNFIPLVHEEDRGPTEEAMKALHSPPAQGLRAYIEQRAMTKEGWLWLAWADTAVLDSEGNVKEIIGVGRDISWRKQAEEELQKRDIQFRKLSDQVPGMIYQFMQKPDGSFSVPFTSEGIRDIFGCFPRDVKDDFSPIGKAILPEDLDLVISSIKTSARRMTPWFCEYRVQLPGQSVRWMEGRSTPEKLDDGSIIWHGFNADITERKRAEEEQDKLQAQLIQAQKMESVGRLAGGVAHDFNNMLGVIMGNAELALEKTVPNDHLHENLKDIIDAARRSSDITRQLLAFARRQTIDPKVIDLNETVERILKMLRRLIGEDIDFSWQPSSGLWPVKMDPSQLDQLLSNLLINARAAIEGVGRVTIETDNVTFDEAYCDDHADFVPGDFVLLAVSDDGCGMDRDTLDNIFEPFFTTKAVGQGTGLGLSTVYGIVKQNDGVINVYSEPDKGTTFKLYLPRHGREAAVITAKDQENVPVSQGETVLIVEDETSLLELTRRFLDRLGYTVLEASTPARAMDLARDHKGKIHLLITDVVMPEMNGKDLAERLQALYPDLSVLFMSGYTANVIAHRAVLNEGVHFMQKPFFIRDLAVKVREALDG